MSCVSLTRPASFIVVCAFLCVAAAAAQQPLQGHVRDPLGRVVINAQVELLEDQKVVGSTSTGASGTYTLPIPESHRFQIRASAASFRTTWSEPLYLNPREGLLVDITLQTPTYSDQVTVTATGTPTPLAQSGAALTVLSADSYPYSPEIQQPLRLIPGVQMTQAGQTGAVSTLFLRGGDSSFTKVLLDDVPVNDVGGVVNFANIATVGIAQIEVLREPNSALYGSDALSGVVSLTTERGSTPLPLLTYAVDGGNLGFRRQEADLAGAHGRFDFYTGFARLDTSNNIANDAFHNATVSGNYGFAPDTRTDVRLTLRHVVTNGGQPNAIALYGIPDSADQKEQDTFVNATAQQQTNARWHNLLRYGHEALHQQFFDYAPTGIPYTSYLYDPKGDFNGYVGLPVTLTGANGYTVSGQALFQYPGAYPTGSSSTATRDFVYAQTDYKLNAHTTGLAAFKYEAERGSAASSYALNTVDRGDYSYTLQLAGDARSRLFYTVGSGIEDSAVYGKALTPRASLAVYAVRPGAQSILSGTKLHASFGKGVLEPTVYEQNESLYGFLASSGLSTNGVSQLGAQYARTYDAGVEQQLGDGRARLNATWFYSEFTNGIQYVSQSALINQLGVSPPVAAASPYGGAYVNSQAFRAEGAELEAEYRLTRRVFVRAGYTYLDAVVQRSFSSDALSPTFNTSFNFPNIPIGVYAPLVGARPFRRAPHTGFFAVSYASANGKLSGQLSGTLVGRRDDSTFLSDKDYGNSLLLPNRNLDGGYQRLELSADYKLTRRLTTYADLQNLLNEKYAEAFGYPALPFNLRGGVKFTFGGESWRLR